MAVDEGDRPSNLLVAEGAQPSLRAAGSASSHDRIAWMTRMSARRVITASPPGRISRASTAISPSVRVIHSDDAALRCG